MTRTIVPYVWQKDAIPGTSQQGVGDKLFNAWYSDTLEAGLTWGAGPIVRIPTRSDVSTDTWAAGLTGIVLTVNGPWTYGGLANHLWDVESDPETPTSATFGQPFAAYTTPNTWTFTVTSESAYDWNAKEWSIPINLNAAKRVPVGGVPVNLTAGIGYWAASPEGLRFRFQAQLVFPRGSAERHAVLPGALTTSVGLFEEYENEVWQSF